MNHSPFPEPVREILVRQLLYFDENRYALEALQSLEFSVDRRDIVTFVEHYVQKIECLLAGESCDPFDSCIWIGSAVELRFEEENLSETFVVVFPEEIDVESNRISFLSPLGRALIFAKRNESVSVHSPQGTYTVTVIDHAHSLNHDAARPADITNRRDLA